MKKYKVTKIEDKVFCREVNQLEKPEYIDFNKGMHPAGGELSYNKELKAWQEAEDKLDRTEYELMMSWENEDGSSFIFHRLPDIGWVFYGELVDGKILVVNQ